MRPLYCVRVGCIGLMISSLFVLPQPLIGQEPPLEEVAVPEDRGHIHGLIDWMAGNDELDSTEVVSLQKLARLIDHLDKSLSRRGQVVVKGPDVWGQNRLTQYRVEYETEMAKQLTRFEIVLNGYQRRADLAAFTSATSIGASAGPQISRSRNVSMTTTPAPTQTAPTIPSAAGLVGPTGLVANANTLLGGPASPLLMPSNLTGLALANQGSESGLGLESTVLLDERSRFINHLHQLRRTNIGDDRSDLPGYSLYLVRTPVSILPGAQSIEGKGAMVTVEAKHDLTPDLLPNTFRNVVILDTAYQLAEIVKRGLDFPLCDEPAPPAGSHGVNEVAEGDNGNKSSNPLGNAGRHAFSTPVALASSGSRGLASVGSSEAIAILGETHYRTLVDAVQGDQSTWYRHDPSVISWLIGEISTAFGYMKEQARLGNPLFQPEVFENVGSLALMRDYQALAFHREKWLQALARDRHELDPTGTAIVKDNGPRRVRPIDILAFALMVQCVVVDRQIKNDMQVMVERKHCECGDPFQYNFANLWPDDAARQAFNLYVACKWPIHVFSLDPIVDQQNQLDLFSERTELQLALATAIATGQASFQNATTYARRREKDLSDIALNRTAVGFGAGDTTFGWRFYPRLQTPPIESNPRRISNILLYNGPGNDYAAKHAKIEPGLRECYALMVVPNFAPKIRLTTVTNWFDLKTKHPEQQLETTDMICMGRKLETARQALQRVCDAGRNRPVDMEVLGDRITQLEAMLPLQAHDVILPFEADFTGSEIFSSTNSALFPRLLSWYGEPPVEGADSSIFILGTGFIVHEMKAVAGGQTLTDSSNFDMLSRNILRIVIPKTAVAVETGVVLKDENGHILMTSGKKGINDVQTVTITNARGGTFTLAGTDPLSGLAFQTGPIGFLADLNILRNHVETALLQHAIFASAQNFSVDVSVGTGQARNRTGGIEVVSVYSIKITMKGQYANVPMSPLKAAGSLASANPNALPSTTIHVSHTTLGVKNEDPKPLRKRVIDVHVASPNGISNHLLVDLLPKELSPKKSEDKSVTTTATTTNKVNTDGSTTVTTEFKTIPPGVVLPYGTSLQMGGGLPAGMQVGPGSAIFQATPPPFPPGTVPNTPYTPPAKPATDDGASDTSADASSPASDDAEVLAIVPRTPPTAPSIPQRFSSLPMRVEVPRVPSEPASTLVRDVQVQRTSANIPPAKSRADGSTSTVRSTITPKTPATSKPSARRSILSRLGVRLR